MAVCGEKQRCARQVGQGSLRFYAIPTPWGSRNKERARQLETNEHQSTRGHFAKNHVFNEKEQL